MKKVLSILICAMLMIGMFAGCGSGEKEQQGENLAGKFSVGYAKAVISPETSVYLCGYGDAREDYHFLEQISSTKRVLRYF